MPRERRNFTRITGIKDPSLIVIATEGQMTEQQYFAGLQSKCEASSSKIHIKVLEARNSEHSAPKFVLAQLNDYKRYYGLNSNDELCMVIDRDKKSWETAEIAHMASECDKKQFLFALSNPCFEIWLLLHLTAIEEYTETEKAALLSNRNDHLKKEVRRLLGSFNPSKLDFDDFWDGVAIAIERAAALDTAPQQRWSNSLGSRVYLLMQKVLAASEFH